MKRSVKASLVLALLVGGGTAQAQNWGYPGGYGRPVQPDWQAQSRTDWICSGQRARQLEGRLRHEVREGDIDPDAADRIHFAIDDMERRQQQECAENDWRSIGRIADRYDRIDRWIGRESGRSRWRGW